MRTIAIIACTISIGILGVTIGILYEKTTITICDAGTEVEIKEDNLYPAWQYDCDGEIVIVVD